MLKVRARSRTTRDPSQWKSRGIWERESCKGEVARVAIPRARSQGSAARGATALVHEPSARTETQDEEHAQTRGRRTRGKRSRSCLTARTPTASAPRTPHVASLLRIQTSPSSTPTPTYAKDKTNRMCNPTLLHNNRAPWNLPESEELPQFLASRQESPTK